MKYQLITFETAVYETALECWEELGTHMQRLCGKTIFIRSAPEVHARENFINGKTLYCGTMRISVPETQP